MEERMMNLVSLIADQVQTKQELFSNEGRIMDALMHGGYHLHEADAAITLMQTLARSAVRTAEAPCPLPAVRAMSREERGRFAPEAFALVVKLAAIEIIDAEQREDILERSLSLQRGKIELETVKTVLALALFGDAADRETLGADAKHRRGAFWN